MAVDLFQILLLVGAGHALLLAATLFSIRRGNRLANRIFAATLIVFAAIMVFDVIASTEFLLRYPHLSKIAAPLAFLLGPLFFLYVKAMTEHAFGLRKQHLLHFLPALVCGVALTPYYIQPASAKIAHLLADQRRVCVHCLILHWSVTLQILAYIVGIAKLLIDYKKRTREKFSSLEKINLNWLRNLLIAVFVTWCASLVIQFVFDSREADTLSWLVVSVNIFLIGYFGLRQPAIFGAGELAAANLKSPHKKYEKSTLTPERAEAYLRKLQELMQREKPYLQSDLTLPTLAKKLAISSHHLSQIINEKLHQNFFEYVNSHRVEEAKQRIADPRYDHRNLAEIGFEVGFNSISSFNAVFKRQTGMTPSRYRERRHAERAQFKSA